MDARRSLQWFAWTAVLLTVVLIGSWVHLWASESRFSGLCEVIAGEAEGDGAKKLRDFASTLNEQFCY